MPIAICLFLLAAALVLAALLRSPQRGAAAPPPAAPRPPEIEPADAERLGEVIELLRAVMDHPAPLLLQQRHRAQRGPVLPGDIR